jgi:hypothetical protein
MEVPSSLCGVFERLHSSTKVGYMSMRLTVMLEVTLFAISGPAQTKGTFEMRSQRVCFPQSAFSPGVVPWHPI